MCPHEVYMDKLTFTFMVFETFCKCKYLFLCQANKYLLTDDSLQSALNPIPDQDPVEEQPGYMTALQPDFKGIVGSHSVSRVTRTALREPEVRPVSNALPDEAIVQ